MHKLTFRLGLMLRIKSMPRLSFVLGVLLSCLVLASCVHNSRIPDVEIVRDLSDVVGCRFITTVGAPPPSLGYRAYAGYENYLVELKLRVARAGANRLYLNNPSAGWGGASALGSAYLCTPY